MANVRHGPGNPIDDAAGESKPDRSGGYALAAILVSAGGWFGVSWLMMGSPPADAVGEASGGMFAVLVVVSVVGAVRHSRRG